MSHKTLKRRNISHRRELSKVEEEAVEVAVGEEETPVAEIRDLDAHETQSTSKII